jgi:hypothetical protein
MNFNGGHIPTILTYFTSLPHLGHFTTPVHVDLTQFLQSQISQLLQRLASLGNISLLHTAHLTVAILISPCNY